MKKLFFVVVALSLNALAGLGTGTSNGGDETRSQFILKGKEIIAYLEQTPKGKQVSLDFKLNLKFLDETLDIKKIQVVEGPLIDNSGSIVDAIGVPGFIRLDQKRWETFFASGNDIYYLIFHEMLRSAAVNDDGYVISFKINPFLQKTNPDKLSPNLPDMIFKGMSYDLSMIEPFKIETASASIYRNTVDGQMKLGFGFVEKSFSADPCAEENRYSHNPSATNKMQRLLSVSDIPVRIGFKTPLTNDDFWVDPTSPGGRIYFFNDSDENKKFAYLYPNAFGDVTILNLTDDSVTVQIDHFVGRGEGAAFEMNGKATLKLCK